MTVAIGLDLGSTRIKAGRLAADGALTELFSLPAPDPVGSGLRREGDPEEYRRVAERVLTRATEGLSRDVALGVATQRSSFLLWEKDGGRPVTPLISWQDRSAAPWCEHHAELAPRITERTGLPLSPHYVGPKLAARLERDHALAARVRTGELRLGTLDAYLISHWSDGRSFRTDPTMAARTLLLDVRRGDWSQELAARFGVTTQILPRVHPSFGEETRLARCRLFASLADQAAGLLALAGGADDVALVNFGTGCFVLRPTGERFPPPGRYLAGPVLGLETGTRYALEGTVNGGGAVADRFGTGPTELPERDPAPDAFCLPDSAGVGAPHWRPRVPFTFSPGADALPEGQRRRIVLEGLLFRVREILDDLFPGSAPGAVVLSGGLTRDPFLGEGLRALVDRPVEIAAERESTLTGVAKLAANLHEEPRRRAEPVARARRGDYLPGKFGRWKAWIEELLNA